MLYEIVNDFNIKTLNSATCPRLLTVLSEELRGFFFFLLKFIRFSRIIMINILSQCAIRSAFTIPRRRLPRKSKIRTGHASEPKSKYNEFQKTIRIHGSFHYSYTRGIRYLCVQRFHRERERKRNKRIIIKNELYIIISNSRESNKMYVSPS